MPRTQRKTYCRIWLNPLADSVLALLDAENNFAYTSTALYLLSANGRIPAMIVVGIITRHDSLRARYRLWRRGQVPVLHCR
jgi:hypothetical protein